MPSGDVRDLLVQLRLDQQGFKREIGDARGEVKKLEAQFKAVKSDRELTDAGAALKENLQAQLKEMDGLIENTKKQLQNLQDAWVKTKPGSKEQSGIARDITAVETSLANAETKVNALKTQLEALNNLTPDKLDQFLLTMEGITQAARDMEMAYGFLIGDWAKETADSADEINVSREQALAMVEKIAAGRDGWFEGWDREMDTWIRDLITGIPIAYEEVSEAMANGLQAGGVAVDKIKDYTDVFVRMEKATDLTGEEGSRHFGKFLTVMETEADAYENVASTIVALGNSVAATESQIVETSMRSAAALRAVGMSEADILGVSAGALMLGMEPAAAASSLEKLAIKAGGSAEFAAKGYEDFRKQLKAAGEEVTSFYDLKVAIDADSKVRKGLIADLGMTGADFDRLMKNAVQAEKVAGLMGQTVDEFAAAWAADPAKYFVSLFETVGKLDESGAESLFNILGELGITEIRESRLARNFAMVSESLMATLELARLAEKEGTALDTETAKLFATTRSQRQMNENKSQNFLQAIGEGATEVRQTWDDVWANMKQTLTESLPEWAQTGIGVTVEVLNGLGDVISGIGKFSQGIYYTGQVLKMLKNVDWSAVKSVAAKGGMVLGLMAGTATYGALLSNMLYDATAISEALSNIEITVDEESKKKTLSAIEEVRAAAEALNNQQLDERFAGTSAVVQRGFGTANMFGQALGYEQEKMNRELEKMYADAGARIRELENQLLGAVSDGEARAIQQQIEAVELAMEAQAGQLKAAYTDTLEALFAGAMKSQGTDLAMGAALVYGKQHEALLKLFEATKLTAQEQEKFLRENNLYTQLAGWGIELYGPLGDVMGKDAQALIKDLYEVMSRTAKDVLADNGGVMAILGSMLDAGALENADLGALDGLLMDVLAATNLKAVGDKGAGNWREIGQMYMGGMALGLEDGKGNVIRTVTSVMQAMLEAARAAVDVHSPSRKAYELGVMWDAGLAGGLLDGRDGINSAVRRTMGDLQKEAEKLSPRINAAFAVAKSGAGGAEGGGPVTNSQSSTVVNNHYALSGADIYTQQGIRKLAQQIARIQKKTNGSVGKM